ncbi:MAG: ATP phosphoribosyltransferase regulatory subunit [Clostridiaceae bacterium]
MLNWMRYIPEGTKDILFDECKEKIRIEEILNASYRVSGFNDIISPTLEFYDVFNGDHTTIAQEKMYKLFDNHGRILVLRPDLTTPVARITATKLNEAVFPIRFCYTSNVFRVNESMLGKTNEITQSGVEIVGVNSVKADAETIITGINALRKCGMKDFKIEIGHAEFFKSLVDELNADDECKEKIRRFVEDKNLLALDHYLRENANNFPEYKLKALRELPKLFGGIDTIEKAQKLTNNRNAAKALQNIMDVYGLIERAGLASFITIDLGMVRHMDYYTGIIFRAFTYGTGGYILSGGRYDDLIIKFGRDLPAVGFAIDVDSLITAMQNKGISEINRKKHLVLFYSEEFANKAFQLSDTLKENSFICELSLFDTEEETLKYSFEKRIFSVISLMEENKIRLYRYNKKWSYKDFDAKYLDNFLDETEKTNEE